MRQHELRRLTQAKRIRVPLQSLVMLPDFLSTAAYARRLQALLQLRSHGIGCLQTGVVRKLLCKTPNTKTHATARKANLRFLFVAAFMLSTFTLVGAFR
jgi:hypothetical protein